MIQRVIEITSPLFIARNDLPAEGGFSTVFGNDRPLALEIGCGIGDFIAQMARQRPEHNYLAIDIYNKGCLKTCRRVEEAQLENVRVSRVEALYLLEHHVPPQSLAAVYINCPDPWPKKRHRGRRLVNKDFLQRLLYYLRPGGEVVFSTDFTDYAEDVAALHPDLEGYENCLPEPKMTELPGYPLSKYMNRFLDLGQPIHYIRLRKKEDAGLIPLPPKQIEQGFRVLWKKTGNE